MRIHTDREPLDGAAIAFVVIILLTIVALEILLSRLNAFFEANAMAGEDRQTDPRLLLALIERTAVDLLPCLVLQAAISHTIASLVSPRRPSRPVRSL